MISDYPSENLDFRFDRTMQKGISRWGSCVLQRIIDFKTQTKLFNIFGYLC
jgi:hypothetical protein